MNGSVISKGGPMKKACLTVLILTMIISPGYSATNPTSITSIGSNPWFSTALYPQDMLQRQGMYLFYSPDYHNKPYWGDIDEPANKPTNTRNDYSITGADVVRNGGSFKYSGVIHSINNNVGFARQFQENVMAAVEVDYNVDALRNRAEGTFTGSDTNYYPADSTLPFNYSLRHTMNQLSGRGIFSTMIGDVPFGVKLEAGRETTLILKKELSFSKLTKDSLGNFTTTRADFAMEGNDARALWGWTEPGCSHPFGARGTQGDSWLQNSYAIGPIYHIDLMTGATFDKVKAGGYFRYKWGHQTQYSWKPTGDIVSNDTVISNNFIGSYTEEDQAKISNAGEGRVFGNIHWRQGDRFALNTFAAVTYLDSTTGSAALDNLEAESSSKEKIRSVALEFDPNINVKLGEFLNYVDGAILCRYRYSRYNNTYDRWVGGGELKTYWDTEVYGGWEDVWENFSYANENALDLGADLATMFPIFSGGPHYLSLNLRLFGDVRFTYQKKYYGQNAESGSALNFNVENKRKNFSREVMFNTSLMLHYMQGPYQIRLQFTKPVLYSIARSTSVTNGNNDIVDDGNNYPLKKSPLWITQEGMSVALYALYDISGSLFRNRSR